MTEASEREPKPQGEDEPRNPSSEELEVEGPNESAPGHEPARDEDPGDRPSETAE
jgi:hypothetical protein